MSSLIFFTSESEALIFTDTLVVDAVTKEQVHFCSKALYLPHINTIIASTGIAGFADQWCLFVNNGLRVTDVEGLSNNAQPLLLEAFNRYQIQFPFMNDVSVTIYHFGFSKTDKKIKAYAHRSENDFFPEILDYGLGIKPVSSLPNGSFSPEEIILPLMKKQAIEQEQSDKKDRVCIGGEIHALHLTDKGCMSYKVGEL